MDASCCGLGSWTEEKGERIPHSVLTEAGHAVMSGALHSLRELHIFPHHDGPTFLAHEPHTFIFP